MADGDDKKKYTLRRPLKIILRALNVVAIIVFIVFLASFVLPDRRSDIGNAWMVSLLKYDKLMAKFYRESSSP